MDPACDSFAHGYSFSSSHLQSAIADFVGDTKFARKSFAVSHCRESGVDFRFCVAQFVARQNDVELFQDESGPYFQFHPVTASAQKPLMVRLSDSQRFRIGAKDDLLKKAVGMKKDLQLHVMDLTAGLLRDSQHLLLLECHVTAIEENPLLAKAIELWLTTSPQVNFKFIAAEAGKILSNLTKKDFPDVIYYDPMFGDPKRKAGAGKESLLLQMLCKPSIEEQQVQLLQLARQKVKNRVVVKRPQWASSVGNLKPDFTYVGKAVRYDAYLPIQR